MTSLDKLSLSLVMVGAVINLAIYARFHSIVNGVASAVCFAVFFFVLNLIDKRTR